ncbi:MAG TPA: hypothetical protein VGI42_03935 [Chthoniobacterales bacterium]
MRTPSSLGRAYRSVCYIILGTASAALASDVVLQKVPTLTVEQAPAYPQNLARYHLGAQVEAGTQSKPISSLQISSSSEDQNAAEAALLCDDPTVGYKLSSGLTTLLVSLPKIENIETVSFLNTGARGEVTIAVASAKLPADSPQWRTAVHEQLSEEGIKAKIGPGEAKYVKVTFNVTQPGRIAGFGVYSPAGVADFTMPRPRKFTAQDHSASFALINYNLSDLHAKARALYVSSGSELKQANNMIDDQTSTSYNFTADDNSPTAVIDLGKVCTVQRLSAIYSGRPGSIDFYVMQSLPAHQTDGNASATSSENTPDQLKVDADAFAKLKPVGSVVDDGKQGRASVNFSPTAGRYVMLRWIPASHADNSFSVAEIAAFGPGQNSLLASNGNFSTAERKTLSDSKDVADSKDLGDNKESPAEGPPPPAEGPPPGLPDPPPFTFIPQIVPTSP